MLSSVVLLALCLGAVYAKSLDTVNTLNTNVEVLSKGWHIHVTMHVYSGRADPTWLIHSDHPSYAVIIRNMASLPKQPIPSKLGYKGFTLVHVPPGQSANKGGHYNHTVASYMDWEMLLLQTSAHIDDDLRDHAKQAITGSPTRRRRSYNPYNNYPYYNYGSLFHQATVDPINALSDTDMYRLVKLMGLDKKFLNITTTPPPRGPTKYEPKKWNKYFVKDHNNCYNYANNRITDTFAQPGRAGKCPLSLYSVSTGLQIEKAAVCDGLKVVPALSSTRLPSHQMNLVALVYWPPKPGSTTFDYHWYRLDGNGRWSHKPGKTDATNVDQSGRYITDPRTADRGSYTEFISFLQTSQETVLII